MPYYSDDLVEEVRSKNDIVDVIGAHVRLQKKGSTYFGLCPFHNEKTPSFSVTPGKQMFYCFGCGAGGNVFTFLMKYENYTFSEALGTLAERVGVPLPKKEYSREQEQEADQKSRLLLVNKEAAKYYYSLLYSPRGRIAFDYFKRRLLSDETMKKFGLGYSDQYSNDLYLYLKKKGFEDQLLKESGLITVSETRGANDKFWNRAMFPIMDERGRVIGFGGRVMGEGEPKYLNSPETKIFDKSRNLYGLNIARTSRKECLILCEGYMDVISLHQAGFTNAVASLGTSLTEGHVGRLKRYTKEVYLAYDSDGAGIRAALRAISLLNEAGIVARVINMRPHKDPDEFIKALGSEEFQKRMDQAENSFLFEIRMLERSYRLDDPEGKTAFFHKVAEYLLRFNEELERNNYLETVAKRYDIRKENLLQLVVNMGNERGIVRQRVPLRSGQKEKRKKEDGILKAQKLLLMWLSDYIGLFHSLQGYLLPDDFTDEFYRKVAEQIFLQYQENQVVNPAMIISMFEEEEEQGRAAEIFNTKVPVDGTKENIEKAVKDTVIMIKTNRIRSQEEKRNPTDMDALIKIIEDKRALEQLGKLNISID